MLALATLPEGCRHIIIPSPMKKRRETLPPEAGVLRCSAKTTVFCETPAPNPAHSSRPLNLYAGDTRTRNRQPLRQDDRLTNLGRWSHNPRDTRRLTAGISTPSESSESRAPASLITTSHNLLVELPHAPLVMRHPRSTVTKIIGLNCVMIKGAKFDLY